MNLKKAKNYRSLLTHLRDMFSWSVKWHKNPMLESKALGQDVQAKKETTSFSFVPCELPATKG